METGGGNGSETGSVTKVKKLTTGICVSLILDFRDKEESKNFKEHGFLTCRLTAGTQGRGC